MLRLLPLVLFPALAAGLVYWLTRSRGAAVVAAAIVLGAMLYIGVTS